LHKQNDDSVHHKESSVKLMPNMTFPHQMALILMPSRCHQHTNIQPVITSQQHMIFTFCLHGLLAIYLCLKGKKGIKC